MARTQPTIVASSPIARCRKPPTFALAYISPARSSKRRISIIAASHSLAASGSGSSCCSARSSVTSVIEDKVPGTVRPQGRAPQRLAPAPGRRSGIRTWLQTTAVRAAPSCSRPRSACLESGGRIPAAPALEELLGVELGQVGAQRARQAAGLARLRVPEQHDLAGGDLDDLDVVAPLAVGQQRGPGAALGDDQLVGAVRPHAAAASSPRSPWKTRSPTCRAGTS